MRASAKSPSFVASSTPLVAKSRRPTGRRGRARPRAGLLTVGRPSGSLIVETTPRGLWRTTYTAVSARALAIELDLVLCASALAPSSLTTCPFTRTRPSTMSSPRRVVKRRPRAPGSSAVVRWPWSSGRALRSGSIGPCDAWRSRGAMSSSGQRPSDMSARSCTSTQGNVSPSVPQEEGGDLPCSDRGDGFRIGVGPSRRPSA